MHKSVLKPFGKTFTGKTIDPFTGELKEISAEPANDEEAAAKALNEGVIAGMACDVLSIEPPPKDTLLFKAKNCIITPHIAWQTIEARERLIKIAIDNFKAFVSGRPVNKIN